MEYAEWISTSEAAELTGYAQGHVRRLAREGMVEARKVTPRAWIVNRRSLLDYHDAAKPGRPTEIETGAAYEGDAAHRVSTDNTMKAEDG